MASGAGDRDPKARLSRRTMLRLTGGGVVGTMLGCSGNPAPYLDKDGAVGPNPDSEPAPDSAPPAADLLQPDQQIDSEVVKPDPGPIFFVHLSDIHIGSGSLALPALDFGLSTILPSFPSIPVFATGDLVETGNDLVDWAAYQKAIDGAGLMPDDYIEVPGNHDATLDSKLVNYLKYTLAGRNGHGTHGLYHRMHQGRLIRIVALNTCSGGDLIKNSAGYLELSQVDALIKEIDLYPQKAHSTVVLGHHPPSAPLGLGLLGTDAHLRKLLKHTSAAAYLHGHLHMHYANWEGKTLMAQAPSLGNPSEGVPGATVPGFNIFALDDGPVTKGVFISGDETSLSVGWPVVMITKPADLDLGKKITGGTNPWAVPLPRSSTGHVLHAGVFAPDPILAVRCRVDDQPWQTMTKVADYYRAEFDTPDKGSCTIEVQGQTSTGAVASDTIKVGLA